MPSGRTLCDEPPVKAKANQLPDELIEMSKESLSEHITTRAIKLFCNQPKPLQVNPVSLLVQGNHIFVCAGTGFGKTRISEMFFGLFKKKVVVLVLNPLDSLGDDQVITSSYHLVNDRTKNNFNHQVREKNLVSITAINLTKMTLNYATIKKIKNVSFSFVYLVSVSVILKEVDFILC
jgi:hypothetical protein